jgi:hypothetical protein
MAEPRDIDELRRILRQLQVPPTPNPEGVLQHDVRCTDTIMDTAPVACQSATTLSTPMHPMTIGKPRWGLGSDLTRTQGALRDPGLRCISASRYLKSTLFSTAEASD